MINKNNTSNIFIKWFLLSFTDEEDEVDEAEFLSDSFIISAKSGRISYFSLPSKKEFQVSVHSLINW